MTAHCPCVNGLILKTNIPIVIRDGVNQFMPNVFLAVRDSLILFLSFLLVFSLVVGACLLPTTHDFAVKSPQPLARRDLELDLHTIRESQLGVATEVNSNHRFGNDLWDSGCISRDVDVVVLTFLHQCCTGNLGILRQLIESIDPQPRFQSLYPHPVVFDEEGFVVLLQRNGVYSSLELQLANLEPLFLQGMKGHDASPQPRFETLLHLGLEDGQGSVFILVTILVANFDRDLPCRGVGSVKVVLSKTIVVKPLCLLEQVGQMILSSHRQMGTVNLTLKDPTGLGGSLLLCQFGLAVSLVHEIM